MTTPREDAIAALAEAIMAAESDDDVPWNERPRPGQVLDNLKSLGWRLAALGAEAETPGEDAIAALRDTLTTATQQSRRLGYRTVVVALDDLEALLAAMRETGR